MDTATADMDTGTTTTGTLTDRVAAKPDAIAPLDFDRTSFYPASVSSAKAVLEDLNHALKVLICEALQLEDVTPDDIDDAAPLFGDGLGLDSVDALELAIEIEKAFGVRLTQDEADRAAFSSIDALAEFLRHRSEV